MRTSGKLLAFFGVLTLAATSVGATSPSILAGAWRTSPTTGAATIFTPVPLNNAGSTLLRFSTNGPRVIKVTYNAECQAVGTPNVSSWIAVEIRIDGVATHPNSGLDFAFCAPTPGATRTSAVREVLVRVPAAGLHTVQVLARRFGNATLWTFDDSILIVEE